MLKTSRFWGIVTVAFLASAHPASAQQIEQGKIKTLDLDGRRLVVTQGDRDRPLTLTEQTRVLDAQGRTLAERLTGFKEGVGVFFQAARRDGGEVAVALRLVRPGERAPGRPREEVRRGKLKQIDAEKALVVITADDKDLELRVTDQSNLAGARGGSVAEKLAGLRAGAEVQFFVRTQDDQSVLGGLRIAETAAGGVRQRISPEHAHLRPLTELGTDKYLGFTGGLYPGGANERPAAHEAAGLRLARKVEPLDAEGKPDPAGKVVLLSLGMSNTSQASQGFQQQLRDAAGLNPQFVFVNGAQGGMVAAAIQDPEDGRTGTQFWRTVDDRLKQAGVTRQQVQAVWIKQADPGPREGFPGYAQKLQRELKRIIQLVAERFPNARLCYLSGRTYGGYATTPLNPEPAAYESGFAVKWLIEEQLKGEPALNCDPAKGEVKAPWLSWGPYLWANGATQRADGFSYDPADFVADGTHHSPQGVRKMGERLLDFFRSDATTRPWVLAAP